MGVELARGVFDPAYENFGWRILGHLERWASQVSERSPPLDPEAWSAHASPPFTYDPFSDVA